MWMRALGRLLPGPTQAVAPELALASYSVLFMRYERIGDMIMATSLIRVIASSLTTGKVDVLATSTTAPVLDGNPHVGKVLTLDRRSVRSYLRIMRLLRRERYPVMVDGRINNPPVFTSTPLLMLAAGAKFRIGAGGEREPRIYNISLPEWTRDTHYIDGSKRLAIPFGVDPETVDWQPELFLSREEKARAEERWKEAAIRLPRPGPNGRVEGQKRLLVNLSASEPKRRWPDGKFIATLQVARLRNPDMPILVMGLPSEWASVQEVASRVQGVAAQTPQLRAALALVGTADMVFTPDTSISHAASAFRKPSLVLLKREHRNYRPYNTPGEIVSWGEDEIAKLPHERVSGALDKLITEFGR
jgi:ADP-heptose:LPS heptosyltransferase